MPAARESGREGDSRGGLPDTEVIKTTFRIGQRMPEGRYMKKIRNRSEEEILSELREKAQSYTPEWRFDAKKPDIGGALAKVYAGMQNRLDRKYALLPEKFRIDYFNCLNTSMKSAAPAEGYVVFGLSGEDTDAAYLVAGTPLRSDAPEDDGTTVPVELTEDVCVVPDTLSVIYETRGSKDYIGLLYDRETTSEEEEAAGFPLFDMSAENLERHVFRLSHPYLFRLNGHGSIGLRFYDSTGELLSGDILSRFTDPAAVRFYYVTGEDENESEETLSAATIDKGTVWIKKHAAQEAWGEKEVAGILSGWLCCEVKDIRGLESFSPARITMMAECPDSPPDVIHAAGSDQALTEPCLPFGERFSVFDDVYFGAADALSKKGARIELKFQEEFVRIPIIDTEQNSSFTWKLIMKKEELRQEKQYDITIEEVIWEYYNGSGWARLFKGNAASDSFNVSRGSGRMYKKISFICPDDLTPVLAGSGENYYIRARILKINNAYKTMGYYVAPVISDVSISWAYTEDSVEPEYMTTENHLEEHLINIRRERLAKRTLAPVRAAEDNRPAMYLGFRAPAKEGPVRMIWEVEQTMPEIQPEISWEYWRDRWLPLMPSDTTENFRKTGALTWAGIPDAKPLTLFGRELYWIRGVRTEVSGRYKSSPFIRGWYMNGARAVTLRHGFDEYWTLENRETDASIQLLNRHIHDLELWVREDERLSREEIAELTADGSYREVRDENGDRSYAWIRWKQTDSLRRHDQGERVYLLDENEGVLTFGGSYGGRIPAPGVIDGIRAIYSIGGGKNCSLPAGSVTALELSEGFISSVTNPLPLTGGYDRETVSAAIRRAAAEQKHHFRAVTEDDFEEIALSAAGNIRMAKCLSGLDAAGNKSPGTVTLVLLTDDYNDRGAGFENLKERLYKQFADMLCASYVCDKDFFIRRAEMVEIELHVEAVISDYQKLYRIQHSLQETLTAFLDPVTGNFDGRGWEIGRLPERYQMETLIRSAEGIESLRRCTVFARLVSRTGSPAVSYEEMKNMPFVLPLGGRHQFRLERRGNGTVKE